MCLLNFLSIKYSMSDVNETSILVVMYTLRYGNINIYDKILIENLRKHKRWSSRKLLKKFPSKGWSRSGLDSLLKRIDARGNADRAVGMHRTSKVSENVSQHREGRRACLQSSRCSGYTQKSTGNWADDRDCKKFRTAHDEARFGTPVIHKFCGSKMNADCMVKRLERCQELLQRFPSERSVQKVWFTDENTFSVATPINSQNDTEFIPQPTRRATLMRAVWFASNISVEASWCRLVFRKCIRGAGCKS